ncbi:MAG: pirin family protein [Proteobacteria bacterium]|nr:pirin family protein [Pseudomonadota bacterium]
MIERRPFEKLGKSNHGWLNANFHFSFAEYRDPARVHWGALRVWNNDRIAPQSGFPPHPHRDMEIVTYVIKGAITHQDHLGNQGRTEAGQIQVMSAGQGIQHAEYNMEQAETELFQIWILPNRQGVPARWETVQFPAQARDGTLVPLASGRGHKDAIPLYADGALFAGTLKAGQSIRQTLGGKPAYLVPARGKIEVVGQDGKSVIANARDGVAVIDEAEIELKASEDAEIVLVETDKLN